MRRVMGLLALGALAMVGLFWVAGCKSTEPGASPSNDPVVRHYMERRSDLLGQRRRLAGVYGEKSDAVASVDRQIVLVDRALDEHRAQQIREEQARQAVQQMKTQTYVPPVEPPRPPVTQPAATEPMP